MVGCALKLCLVPNLWSQQKPAYPEMPLEICAIAPSVTGL